MWLILVDRSASMGEQFAGFNGVDQPDSDRFSRVSVAVGQLSARGAGLHGAKLTFFTTPELNWPVVDVDGALPADAPEPVGVTDVAGALDWAHAQVVPLDPSVDVHVLLITDLRTTPDTSQLRTAADALLRKATVHLVLMDPNYLTLALASEIAPGRVLLAASVSGLAATLTGLFPRPVGTDLPRQLESSDVAGRGLMESGDVAGRSLMESGDMGRDFGQPAPFVPGPADDWDVEVSDLELEPVGAAAEWAGPQWAAPEWTGEDPEYGAAAGRDGGSLVSRAMALGRSMKRVRR